MPAQAGNPIGDIRLKLLLVATLVYAFLLFELIRYTFLRRW